ncbi:fractalkine-like [Anolis sagrei]|uniref:fractalkine-like n=1 Tax=Anolis sagrei TaxID=38937 RepID=UPI003520B820
MPGQAALLVLGLTWIWPIPAVPGEPEAGKQCKTECPRNSNGAKFPPHQLLSYEKVRCLGKTSVIFTTKRNFTFCAKPEEEWVQSHIKFLDAKRTPPPKPKGTFDKLSQDPTSAPNVGYTHPIQTSTGLPLRTTSVPMRSGANATSFGPSPAVENGDVITLESDTSGTAATPTTDRAQRFAEDVTPNEKDPTHHSGTVGATSSRSDHLNPMRSSISPTFNLVGKGDVPPTPLTTFPVSPSLSASVPDNVEQQRKAVTESNIKDATRYSSVAFVGTSRTSFLTEANKDVSPEPPISQPTSRPHHGNGHQRSQVEVTSSKPDETSTLLSGYRTHIFSLTAVGILSVASIFVGWVWLKRRIPTTIVPKEQVQSLLYNSSGSQEDTYAMQTI